MCRYGNIEPWNLARSRNEPRLADDRLLGGIASLALAIPKTLDRVLAFLDIKEFLRFDALVRLSHMSMWYEVPWLEGGEACGEDSDRISLETDPRHGTVSASLILK